ncbi:nSTAND1 domain-containing NTPase [Hymenobacter convexus]|uniref:nSTAND1 domain-containing NTPase n=1 Tax=Hymenobacter sp. CA1UV-4 TaxID=3063782 RepID=UPI0027140B0C|nr:hypothetical protein [Hymenobacter sp. CA1UV-4]MDO7853537.1 hypothetical protein [Hymenobacter sp. CA1UV-4]
MDTAPDSASAQLELDEPICPYTGLRTFTEKEAIYFRGRVSHVARCLDLLVEQHFVMITGASGDGKSSLVFAGMLPEVRAGFVRARYSNWAVATFRPERSPLANLAQALATALRLPSPGSVETELQRGFSSLVQLYQASALCLPATLPEGLTPAEQRQMLRQAGNLLVVVDQFEEFFTNPENYDGDQPTTAAQTVVNLLLETVRLAQAEGLPIYIVCTMRSDFVGQCAEFRGLIEQVGASQYFVPRLLRHEFLEVIKEPALLSGNRISERLVQRLLYDIGQGQDQLPVLQHALRRIWLAANEGREEMDLLHYAMVGGLSDELPPEDQTRFAAWRATLPAHQQQFLLANAGLRNVLDAHANQLYFEANDLYNQDFQPPLPPGTAERVIEQTFRVLTRTDGQRVVRNRVTGAQVTAILGEAALPWAVVCRILRPFRAEGTTFLSPFLSEDADDRAVLPPDTVLDISHESLIRNWNQLAEWAHLEAKDVNIASDFQQQAGRWKQEAENRGYLLPIGLYRYFSDWYASKKGADSWLTYYQEANPDALLGTGPSETPVGLLTRYLETSRRHLWSELLAARYGVWRLTAAIVLPVLLVIGAVLWWPQRKMQSDYVAGQMVENGRTELATYVQQTKKRAWERVQADSSLKRGNALLKMARNKKDFISATRLINKATKTLDWTVAVLPVQDIARFILNADRLKEVAYRPLLGPRTAADYAFPQMLSILKDDTLALDTELSMLALVNNLKYDRVARANPAMQPILSDLVLRLDQAGPIAPAAGQAGVAPGEQQRRLAVRTARTVIALAYYLACDQQVQTSVRPDSAGHQAVRLELEARRQALLQKLRGYVKAEIESTTGPAPSPVAFGFCLRVLLGQGRDGRADLAFLNGLSPFDRNSRRQFNRLFPSGQGLYAQTEENHTKFTASSGGYLTAAMAFAALGNPAKVLRCLDTLRAQRLTRPAYITEYSARDTTKINSSMALVPYLLKYELLDARSARGLLAACAQASQLPFSELYAATVYDLLSVKPLPAVFDAGQDVASQLSPGARSLLSWGGRPARVGGVSLEQLNLDRVSFSLPAATRDKAWAALQGANGEIASSETLFTGPNKQPLAPGGPGAADRARLNQLALDAFWAKTHGIYLFEIKNLPRDAAQSFDQFSRDVLNLKPYLKATQACLPEDVGTTQRGDDTQNLLTFLQSPIRPEIPVFGSLSSTAHYTCSFDAFFLYQLQRQARQAQPEWPVVQLLDSTAFAEAWKPYPNMTLIRALAKTSIPGNSFREQRNLLLLKIEESIQSRDKLASSAFRKRIAADLLKTNRRLVKLNDEAMPSESAGLAGSPGTRAGGENAKVNEFFGPYYSVAMDNAMHELALEMARGGYTLDAFALADSIIATTGYMLPQMNYAHKIRIAEQAMLTNSQQVQPALDNFLSEYLVKTQAGVVGADDEETNAIHPSTSILAVCFWRPFIPKNQLDTIPLIARPLAYRLKKGPLGIALKAPFKGYGLANDLYKANDEINKSPFVFGFTKFSFANQALLGYAHFISPAIDSGWHEYDEEGLTLPADYLSFAE